MIRIFITALLAAFVVASAQAAVEVNKASEAELQSIKGIGPGLSAKIVDARKSGTFKNWSDFVDRVSGVGPGNAARFSQAGLTVGNLAYNAPATASRPATTSADDSRKAAAAVSPSAKGATPAATPR